MALLQELAIKSVSMAIINQYLVYLFEAFTVGQVDIDCYSIKLSLSIKDSTKIEIKKAIKVEITFQTQKEQNQKSIKA